MFAVTALSNCSNYCVYSNPGQYIFILLIYKAMTDAVMYLWPTLKLKISFKMPGQPTGNKKSITYIYSVEVKNKIT